MYGVYVRWLNGKEHPFRDLQDKDVAFLLYASMKENSTTWVAHLYKYDPSDPQDWETINRWVNPAKQG